MTGHRPALVALLGGLLTIAAGSESAPFDQGTAAPPPTPAELHDLWQDGGKWLFSEDERLQVKGMAGEERIRRLQELLVASLPEAQGATLWEGLARRRALMFDEVLTLADDRARLLFLHGPPDDRQRMECSAVFVPIEVWSYAEDDLVLYRPTEGQPFRLWQPLDSKRALYTRQMAQWLDDWHARPQGARLLIGGRACSDSIDRCMCREATRVDRATGVVRLQDVQPDAPDARSLLAYLQPPEDRAAWARKAASEGASPSANGLFPQILEAAFSRGPGQRLSARLLVVLYQSSSVVPYVESDQAEPELRLNLEGVVEADDGSLFDSFRMRFVQPPPESGVPLALEVERSLRPGTYRLRLRLRDEVGGTETVLGHDLRVPVQPQEGLAPEQLIALAPTERIDRQPQQQPDALVLLIPPREVVFDSLRAHAVVQGERIRRVSFLLDGVPQLTRTTEPFTVELKLSRFPRVQVVRAEGYDQHGELVAADQAVINQIKGELELTIVAPAAGQATGEALARVQVVVPEERQVSFVELSINEVLQARLEGPPWEAMVRIPEGEELVYLTAVVELDDGSRAEDLRFLATPSGLEEIDVSLVELFTSVTDRSGDLIEGLGVGDFEVLEDGRPQRLAKVELVRDLPLVVGLTMDVSGSMHTALGEAQRAAEAFLHQVLGPRDRSFLAAFSNQPSLVMPRTSDVFAATQAVHNLKAGGWTSLYDAVVFSLYYFQGTRERRALVLLSDGEDNSSLLTYEDALTYARESGVTIYTIALQNDYIGLGARRQLERLARETGGRHYFITSAAELAGVYSGIERELRSQYLLSYVPDRPLSEGGYRQVEVKVGRRGANARTAAGYFP